MQNSYVISVAIYIGLLLRRKFEVWTMIAKVVQQIGWSKAGDKLPTARIRRWLNNEKIEQRRMFFHFN